METTTNIRDDKKYSPPTSIPNNKGKTIEGLSQKIQEFELEKKLEGLKKTSQNYLGKTESTIKDHPFYAVMGAAAIGYLVGLLFNRKP